MKYKFKGQSSTGESCVFEIAEKGVEWRIQFSFGWTRGTFSGFAGDETLTTKHGKKFGVMTSGGWTKQPNFLDRFELEIYEKKCIFNCRKAQ